MRRVDGSSGTKQDFVNGKQGRSVAVGCEVCGTESSRCCIIQFSLSQFKCFIMKMQQ